MHLPFYNTDHPENVMNYLSEMLPVVQYDIMEQLEITKAWFPEDDIPENKKIYNIRDQVIELGYESHNPFHNLGTITIFGLILVLEFLILVSIFYPLKARKKLTKRFVGVHDWLQKSVFYNGFFYLALPAYIELIVSGFLVIYVPKGSFENKTDYDFVSWFFFALVWIVPACSIYMLTRDIKTVRSKDFKRKWEALYEDLRDSNKGQLSFSLIFCLRRIIFFLIAERMVNTPGL